MKKIPAPIILAIFTAGQIIWGLATFAMAWGEADSGQFRSELEFFFPLFFGNFSLFSWFYSLFSFFDSLSIILVIPTICLTLYFRIFKKKKLFKSKKDFSPQELEIVKKRQEEVFPMIFPSLIVCIIFIVIMLIVLP